MDMQTSAALVVDDQLVFLTRLEAAVSRLEGHWTCSVATSAEAALEHIAHAATPYRIAIVDLVLPGKTGLYLLEAMRRQTPSTIPMVVSAVASEQSVLEAIRLGAQGYLHKEESIEDIAAAITDVLAGANPISPSLARHIFRAVTQQDKQTPIDGGRLTPRHLQILSLLAQGHTYSEAAQTLGISLSTLQTHIRRIYLSLGVSSGAQAVARAKDNGWI